jgi:INO80 complex subunit C
MTEVDIYEVAHRNNVTLPFKNNHIKQGNKRVKPGKQLLIDEARYIKSKEDAFKPNAVFYNSLNSPPSCKPLKKYCDVTGLKANYRSPSNNLQYHNLEVFTVVKNIPQGVDQQYLELRNANVILK